jgi:RNA polymerase sigma-70 factor (ECF subfamily)
MASTLGHPKPHPDPHVDRVARAIRGDLEAVSELVEALAPIIRDRVVRTLLVRAKARRGRDVHQEAEDLTQEIWLALFTDRGRALRAWDPEKGLSLEGFVGLVAERQIASILRSGRRSPWTEDPVAPEDLPVSLDPGASPEVRVENREMCVAVLDRLKVRLTVMGLRLFYLLFVEEKSNEDICRETGLKPGAVHTWKSRIIRMAHEAARDVIGEDVER